MFSGVNTVRDRAEGDQFAVEKDHVVKEQLHGAQVVVADDDELALARGERAQQFAQHGLRVAVQPGEGFIEQINVRALRHRARQEGALLLAAGERADLPVGEVFEPGGGQGLVHRPVVFRAEASPATQRRVTAHLGQAAHGQREIPVHHAALRQVGDGTFRAGVAVLVRVEPDAAGLDGRQADDALEQRRFARAVGSEQPDAPAAVEVQVDVVQRGHAPVGNRQVVDEQAMVGHGRAASGRVGGWRGARQREHVRQRAVGVGPEGFFHGAAVGETDRELAAAVPARAAGPVTRASGPAPRGPPRPAARLPPSAP